jgi:hypothetical protein
MALNEAAMPVIGHFGSLKGTTMPKLLIKYLCATAALVCVAAAPASAHDIKKVLRKPAMVQDVSFTLKRPALARPEVKRLYLGRAPYICGPSGFGQRSRCFLRSSGT